MTPILYSSDEIDFLNNGLGQLVDLYDVDIHEQRNGLLNLTAYYPVNGQHYADISEGNIILAKPSPLDDNHAFRIVSVALDITGYAVMIEADSITYDLTNNLSKTIHMLGDGQAAMTAIQNSTLHPHIFTFYSDITHTSESQLRYVNPMEAIAGTQGSFLQIWGGELKRENRRVAMFNRRGRDNVATFRLGKNIAGLKYTVDVSNLTTEIVPTVTVNSTDVSRTIEGETVQSSRMGNYPLVYSKMVDVSQDVKVDEGDTDDQIKAKINAFAVDWFVKSANTGKDLPEVTVEVEVESLQDSADYADKFAKLETIGLTDTVTVYVPEFGVNVTAIVNELHYDPVTERVTKLSIGTAKVSWADSNKNALNELQDKVTEVKEQATQAVISANGKNSIYSGRNVPAHPQEGDTWFWDDGTNSGIRIFTNGDWVDSVDTKTLERINNAVDGAVNEAQEYADSLSATQSEATSSVAHKLSEAAEELTRNQQNIASQASAYTDSAVADANSKAVSIGQTTAQNAQSALDAAKKDFTSSFASQASQTASMASDVTSKANQYASQAKSEAIAAATTADGVVRSEFKLTTDYMTSTIKQNKSDADGKITKAQTTATQALDGLSTKVERTEYNKTTGDLTSKINETSDTAEQSKQDIVDIKDANSKQDERMLQIEKDATGVKQTVSDLSTEQGKQRGSISKLEQRADGFEATVTKVNNLAVGGRNLIVRTGEIDGRIIGTDGSIVPWDNSAVTPAIIAVIPGKPLTMSGTAGGDNYFRYAFYDGAGKTIMRSATDLRSATTVIAPAESATFRISYPKEAQVKLERGNIATDWSPAPEDVSSATAKAQLTADQATLSINNYKADADGRINKAQADIKLNADAISTKVAKTDYDKKTGDLTTSVNKAQQTADSANQTIGTYKESNDKRVSAAETNIKANSDAIALTVSKTDFDKVTGKLSGDISSVSQKAGEIEQTVSKIQTNVNNLGNVNQLFNTEFSPDFLGWTTEYRWKTGFISDDYSFFKKEIWKVKSSNIMDYIIGNSATIISEPLPYNEGSGPVAASAYLGNAYNGGIANDGVVALRIVFYDANKNFIGKSTGNTVVNSFSMAYVSDSMTPPSGTAYVALNLAYSGTKGVARISQPMLVFNSTSTGSYVPGNYNSNQAVAQVKLTADGLYETVNNPSKGIATRLLTAEGTITTVQNKTNELTSKQTLTANGLTQEIADRKTGDNNTLQAGKDFTTSQITSYDTGMQSRLAQVSDGIMASVSGVNLFTFSRFEDSGNNKWPGARQTSGTINKWEYFDSGNNGISVTSTAAWQGFWHSNIPVSTGQVLSASVMMNNNGRNDDAGRFDIWFVDKSGNRVSQGGSVGIGSASGWVLAKIENMAVPSGAAYMQVSLINRIVAGPTSFALPMVNVGSKALPYTPDVAGQTALQLFSDSFALSLKDNIGNIISGINGDTSGLMLTGKHIFLDGEVTAVGKSWLDGAVIKDATIGRAQIAELSVDSSKIINLDVNKLSGNVANFIRTYWDGRYGSTSIDSEGMTVSAGLTTTVFDKDGMKLSKSGRSVGRIGVNDLYQDFSKKGLYFGLESTGDFMAWGAQNYAGNPYTTKLSWFRAGAVPSNLPGLIEGFNFEDNVAFINPVEMRGGIKLQGANDRLLVRASNLNGGSYPTFGGPSAYFVYAGSDIYLSSNGTAINLTKIAKAFGGIRTAAIPTGFNSNGTATGWYNVDMG